MFGTSSHSGYRFEPVSAKARSGLSAYRGRRRDQRIVDLAGTHCRRTIVDSLPIALEGRPLLERAELHAEADMRSDIHVSRGEAVADKIVAARYRRLQHVEHRVEAAVADHSLAVLGHADSHESVCH